MFILCNVLFMGFTKFYRRFTLDCRDKYEAVVDADALLLVTEWKEFRVPSWEVLRKTMRGKVVIDGRNIYDREEMRRNGFEYECIG